jgi:hypothetical protein
MVEGYNVFPIDADEPVVGIENPTADCYIVSGGQI